MKDINLLPKLEKKKKNGFLFFNFFIAFLLVLLVIIAGFSYLIFINKKELEEKLGIIEKTNFDLNLQKERLLYYKTFEEEAGYKAESVKMLEKNTIKWSRKLSELSKKLPEKIYILNFNGRCDNYYSAIQTLKEGNDISDDRLLAFSIEGYASDYSEISKLILGIKKITDISEPWIATIREAEIQNMRLLYFKIEAYWDLGNLTKDIVVKKENSSGSIRNINIDDL